MSGRKPIDTQLAVRLYDSLGTWASVAKAMPRKGSPFTPAALCNAVRRVDTGKQEAA